MSYSAKCECSGGRHKAQDGDFKMNLTKWTGCNGINVLGNATTEQEIIKYSILTYEADHLQHAGFIVISTEYALIKTGETH